MKFTLMDRIREEDEENGFGFLLFLTMKILHDYKTLAIQHGRFAFA